MAKAQLSNIAFYSLYEIEYYGYKETEHQSYYQKVLRNTIDYLLNDSFINLSEKSLVCVFLLNISLGKAIVYLKGKLK